MQTTAHDALVHRLSRIEGQVHALKRHLLEGAELDCTETLLQVKAATNGLKRFAEALARNHLDRCVAEKKQSAALAQELDGIVRSVFTLS